MSLSLNSIVLSLLLPPSKTPRWYIRNRGCQPFACSVPSSHDGTNNHPAGILNPETWMLASRIPAGSGEEGMATTATSIPTRMPNIWASLGVARSSEHSHYCASLTPASDLPRCGRADFPSRFPRLLRDTNASARACVREENGLVARLVVTSRARWISRHGISADTMRLFSESEENVTWESGLRQVLRRVRHALRGSQYARAGVILQNDRRDEEVAADGGGVLLAPSGVRCRPGKRKELLFRDENSAAFKRATERAGNRAFARGCAVKPFRGKPSCLSD